MREGFWHGILKARVDNGANAAIKVSQRAWRVGDRRGPACLPDAENALAPEVRDIPRAQ